MSITTQESIILDRDPLLDVDDRVAKLVRFDSEEDWLGYRNGRKVGASESANLFNQGYYGNSPYKMWAEKTGLIPRETTEGKFLRIGKLMEPLLRSLFVEETGLLCYEVGEFCLHESVRWPFLVASLDGLVVSEDGVGVLELKNVHAMNRDEWRDGAGPLKYQIQVQHQLAVTGLQYGYLFGLVGGQEPFAHRIERNDSFIENALIPVCERFVKCLESNTPPQVDGSDATSQAIRLLHPDDDGTEVRLDARFVDLDARLEQLKRDAKVITDEQKLIENEIRASIGSATFGVLDNGVRYSFKTQSREGYYVESSKFRSLRRCKPKS